jgi:hypothetical protein
MELQTIVHCSTETVVAPSTVHSLNCSSVVGFLAYTLFFSITHRKKSGVVKSGEQGGNSTGLTFQSIILESTDLKIL